MCYEGPLITTLQPDAKIPPQIYVLAASHGVGTPLKRHQNCLVQVGLVITLLFFFAWLVVHATTYMLTLPFLIR
jgi:hypothetical protein